MKGNLYRTIIESCNTVNEVGRYEITKTRKPIYDKYNKLSDDELVKKRDEVWKKIRSFPPGSSSANRWYTHYDMIIKIMRERSIATESYGFKKKCDEIVQESYSLKDIEDMPYGGIMNDDRGYLTANGNNYSKVGRNKWEQETTSSHTLGTTYTDKQMFNMINSTKSGATTEVVRGPGQKLIKFRSPIIFGASVYDQFDQGLIDPDEEAIEKANTYLDEDLAQYIDDDLSLKSKVDEILMYVNSYGQYIITDVTVNSELTDEEFSQLEDYIEGQLSDGIGEGLEQQQLDYEDTQVEEEYEDEDGEYVTDYVTERAEITCEPWWSGTEYGVKWELEQVE